MEQVAENPVVIAPVVPNIIPETVVQAPPVKDLVTKVADFKKAKASTVPSTTDSQNSFFDFKEIEKITDPVAKEFAMKAYKSMESGVQKKFQDLAGQRREYEQKLTEMQNWSPERIQRELLNNPQFLQAAQQIAGNQSVQSPTDEFSALTPQEKARVDALMSKVNTLEQSNFQATVAQRDSQLQNRYPDYNPNQIDETIKNLAQMNPLDIREHVYKSLKHDEDVAAAYELGRSESQSLNQTKINAITPNGSTISGSENKPARDKNETDSAYLQRIMLHNLAQFKNRK